MSTVTIGLWHDESQNAVLGAILTLPVQQASLLLTVLVFLATVAAGSFWNLTALFLHSLRVRGDRSDILGLQHQAILRNSGTSFATILKIVAGLASWRSRGATRLWARSLGILLPALLVWAAFAAASIFTSRVVLSDQSGAVLALLKSTNCGILEFNTTTVNTASVYENKILNETLRARNYISTFYDDAAVSPTARSSYKATVLPYDLNTTAPCPSSNPDRCILGHNGAFNMKTRFIDSYNDLGINASPAERITLQYDVTCSPVHGFNDTTNVIIDGETYIEVLFGPRLVADVPYTYLYGISARKTTFTYYLYSALALAGDQQDDDKDWVPIPDFNRTDADVTVLFLTQNHIFYLDRTFDPWFLANGSVPVSANSGNITGFFGTNAINAMMCTEQYVLCNPVTNHCSQPQGQQQLVVNTLGDNELALNPMQWVTALRVFTAVVNCNIQGSVTGPPGSALWAQNLVFESASPPLPDDQWRREALGWFQTTLVKLQDYMLDYPSQPVGLGPTARLRLLVTENDGPRGQAAAKMCSNQMVRTAGEVQNFSFFGVMVIVCFSVVVFLLDLFVEPMLAWYHRRRGTDKSSRAAIARQADSVLHLLRLALLNLPSGSEPWKQGSWGVPLGSGHYTRPSLGEDNLAVYNQQSIPEASENVLPRCDDGGSSGGVKLWGLKGRQTDIEVDSLIVQDLG